MTGAVQNQYSTGLSRNNIEQGHLTLHPGGIPHGPAPGAYERSIGKTGTDEWAVMIDTFRPLMLTEAALKLDDGVYYKSWLEPASPAAATDDQRLERIE